MVRHETPPIDDILSYYLAVLRHEEALQSRLRVFSPGRGGHAINLVEPGFGSRYAKLPMGPDRSTDPVMDLLFRKAGTFEFPFAGDFSGLFENWLRNAYFRERRTAMGGGDDLDSTYMVGFPTVFFPGRGEIDLVLRFPLGAVEFQDSGHKPWLPLSYSERKQGAHRALPTSVVLLGESWDPSEPAYSIHTQLLSRTFGLIEEEVADLLSEGRHTEPLDSVWVVRKLIGLLKNPEAPTQSIPTEKRPAELFTMLVEELQRRSLPVGAKVFPVAVVYDGNQSAATRGLQTELRTLRDRRDDLGTSKPFSVVLAGVPFEHGRKTLRGQHQEMALTPEQVEALEIFRDSEFIAVQGPPGTGKTTLVLSALADAIVEWGASLKGNGGVPRFRLSVVASTNNRAVDNAIQPLSLQLPADRLPLALRLGSQEVTQTATLATIHRVLGWLRQHDETHLEAEQRFRELRRAFSDAMARQGANDDPIERAFALRTELEWAEARIAELRARQQVVQNDSGDERNREYLEKQFRVAKGILDVADQGEARCKVLIDRYELNVVGLASKKQIATIRGFLETCVKPIQAPWVEFFRDKGGLALPASVFDDAHTVDQPLSKQEALEVLYDADDYLFRLTEPTRQWCDRALERLDCLNQAKKDETELIALQAKLADLRTAVGALPDRDWLFREGARRRFRLFELAQDVREAWVRLHRREVGALCERAKEMIAQRRTVRPLLESDDSTMLSLGHLFPIVGCTLLSFSNAFGLRKDVISRLIVDEAGQCHPAYILPALARAARAMVIGDIHQLEPVVQIDHEEEGRALRRAKCPVVAPGLEPFRVLAEQPTSAQALANRVCDRVISLKEHYRCQPEIIAISDRLCNYGLRVNTHPKSYQERVPELSAPVILAPVFGHQERGHGSWRNTAEVDRVAQIVSGLLNRGVPPEEIAVLTPYRGQLLALRRRLVGLFGGYDSRSGISDEMDLESFLDRGIALGTVHRFQGGERDIVIFSTTITHPKSLFFLNDRVNLVNVAVSRAKAHLVVVGNLHVLSQGKVTKELTIPVGNVWPEPQELGELTWRFGGNR